MSYLNVFLIFMCLYFMVMYFLMCRLASNAQKATRQLLTLNNEMLDLLKKHRETIQQSQASLEQALALAKFNRIERQQS